jgi:hypothetical protein
MKSAAISAARYAVGSLGLAALAVSATVGYIAMTREKTADKHSMNFVVTCTTGSAPERSLSHAKLGEIAVVGTSEYDRVVEEIAVYTPTFANCAAYGTGRVTIYAHISEGTVGDVTALGSNEQVGRCVTDSVQYVSFPAGEYDVMIPVELFETVSPE